MPMAMLGVVISTVPSYVHFLLAAQLRIVAELEITGTTRPSTPRRQLQPTISSPAQILWGNKSFPA